MEGKTGFYWRSNFPEFQTQSLLEWIDIVKRKVLPGIEHGYYYVSIMVSPLEELIAPQQSGEPNYLITGR